MNVWLKQKVTPAQLMGEDVDTPVFLDADSLRAHLKARRKQEE